MKSKLFICFILTLSVRMAISQTIAIPDSNFEQALIDLGYDTNGLNGNILQSEAESVTNLDVANKGISNLTGIGAFVNLVELNFRSNNLDNVNGIENLIDLEILIGYNTPLTGIDISSNVALKELTIGNNTLGNLDVSNNPLLEELYCYDCQLTAIDLTNNPNLLYLELGNNQLTTLNINNNLTISYLSLYENQLTSINLSNHTALTEVYVYENQLTSLSIKNGNNASITDFEANGNPDLFCIEVDNEVYSTANWTNIDAQTSFSENCDAPTISIPDSNFEQALIDLGYDTNGLNGNILQSEAESVTSLDVTNKGISNLTGIGAFVNLVELNFRFNNIDNINGIENLIHLEILIGYDNLLTSIDVSSNVTLKELTIGNNTLGSLDVSNNPLLEELYCYDCQLTTINLTNNPNLLYLELGRNQLTSINLNNHTALTEVYVYENQLTSLSIKNGNNANITDFETDDNPDLFCIEVDNEAYSTANWTNIDAQTSFSENCDAPTISIPDSNFEQALIDANQDTDGVINGLILQSDAEAVITLSLNNKGINSLQGIEGFININGLVCSNNNLTSLDVSNNTALVSLDFSSNSISNIDLTNNTALQFLLGFSNQLTSLDVSNNTALTYLNVGLNNLTNLDVSNLANLITFNCVANQLTSLDVSTLTNLDVLFCNNNALININLTNATALKQIQCYGNQLTSLDISTNSNLEDLFCFQNNLTSLEVSNNVLLNSIRASRNQLTSLDASNNPALTILSVENNDLTSLNVKNGNNPAITAIGTGNNQNLMCIEVDNEVYSTANWTNIDAHTSFSESCASLGVDDDLFSNLIHVYPNPSSGTFYLQGLQESTKVKVYDINSRVVFNQTIDNNQPIDINMVTTGVYFVNISNSKGSTTKKLIVR